MKEPQDKIVDEVSLKERANNELVPVVREDLKPLTYSAPTFWKRISSAKVTIVSLALATIPIIWTFYTVESHKLVWSVDSDPFDRFKDRSDKFENRV